MAPLTSSARLIVVLPTPPFGAVTRTTTRACLGDSNGTTDAVAGIYPS